jgi:hypothetical protein
MFCDIMKAASAAASISSQQQQQQQPQQQLAASPAEAQLRHCLNLPHGGEIECMVMCCMLPEGLRCRPCRQAGYPIIQLNS